MKRSNCSCATARSDPLPSCPILDRIGEVKHSKDLLPCDGWVEQQKLVDGFAAFKKIDKALHGYTGAPETRSTAHAPRVYPDRLIQAASLFSGHILRLSHFAGVAQGMTSGWQARDARGTVRPHVGGSGICLRCAGMDTADSEAKFLARLAELGAKPAYDRYRGANKPHRVICADGHECSPRPGGVRLGRGICATCAGKDPAAAEAAFRARLEDREPRSSSRNGAESTIRTW